MNQKKKIARAKRIKRQANIRRSTKTKDEKREDLNKIEYAKGLDNKKSLRAFHGIKQNQK